MAKRNRDVKQNLLARKEQLINELKYYEKRIDEARAKRNSSFHDDSSDSEQELTVHVEPSMVELKLKQSMLQTCVFATQELTSVEILQSEVNIVSEPVFERDPPIKEEGTWREVTLECRVDLVPFSMNFYVHQPKRLFSPLLYKNLQVNPVKSAHERELSVSVLTTVNTPSDAVEVLRNYAKAHRSRRSTLARLAETYGHTLFMEPLSEGGYILKCADLLEISWILQNKWSPIAPFHHKMKFDLEYMDESYIKTITQIHRQLSDPSVETDERTSLLSKIINTCLQANKQTDRTKNELNIDNKIDKSKDIKDKDSEIMAPPKLIPKKNKKRLSDDHISAKRAKVDNDKENSSDSDGRSNLRSNFNNDLKNAKQVDKNKAKINENKSKMMSNDDHTEKVDNIQSSNRKLDKNNQLKSNEQKNKDNKIKTDKKEVLYKKNLVNNKVISKSNLKSIDKESLKKKTDKNSQPKTNERNINETTEKDITEQLNRKNKEKDNFTSNSNNDIRSSNKILNKNSEKDKVDLKEKKRKIDEKKTKTVNKDTLDTDKGKNKANLNPNKEGNKNTGKLDTKTDGNKKENDYIKSVNDLKYKNNLIPNKEINKNKINTDKNKPKSNINNENKLKIQTKPIKDSKTKNNVIQNKEISRNKIGNKRKISGNKFEIDRNKMKQTNLTNNSTLSNNERNKIVSKIPKRIPSMELKKNIMRLSPRFIKKPSLKP